MTTKIWNESKPSRYSRATFGGVDQFGAWIDTGYGRTKLSADQMPNEGDQVKIKTKAGEIHIRTIAPGRIKFASGMVVQLVPDAEIAAKAKQRYQAYKPAPQRHTIHHSSHLGICRHCGTYCYGDCTA